MPGNVGKNVVVAYKAEPVYGIPVIGAGGEQFRIQAGQGLNMSRALIEDPEVRNDGQVSMARLGMKGVGGNYPGTLSLGTFNTWIAALFRNTFTADTIALTCTGAGAFVSLATTLGNTLTLVGSGSFLTQGVKVGQVLRLTGMGAGVDSVNAVVATVAANVLTVLGTPWTNILGQTVAALTIKKNVKNGVPFIRSSYTIEQYYQDIDESEQFAGCRISQMKISFSPGSVATVEFGVVGQQEAILVPAAAPGLTNPTQYTSIGMIALDALIYIAGAAIGTATGGELTFNLNVKGQDVVGSTVTPDLWEGPMKVTGQITAIRTALTASHLARYLAETDNVELSLMFTEPDPAPPIDFIHVFLPRLKYLGNTSPIGNDGALIETIPVYAAAKAVTAGYDAVTAVISTSA